MAILKQAFYDRDPALVARELIGCLLVRRTLETRGAGESLCSGIIVETEAYLSRDDMASHSYRGKGKKNASMFLPAGRLYVYSIHAKYCMNVVTEAEHLGSAVLIRAVQPWSGEDVMSARRGGVLGFDISRGPARLCQAMAVDRSHDGLDLTAGDQIWIESPPVDADLESLEITTSPRIGIRQATVQLLRFFADGNPYVSSLRRYHNSVRCDRLIRRSR